jgi:hypothetical protein
VRCLNESERVSVHSLPASVFQITQDVSIKFGVSIYWDLFIMVHILYTVAHDLHEAQFEIVEFLKKGAIVQNV